MQELKETLSVPIGLADIKALVRNLDQTGLEALYRLLFDGDKRTADNAAWVMTHVPQADRRFLKQHRDALIDEALRTKSITKQRLLLRLLEDISFGADDVRSDFLDYCLATLADVSVPYGVRALCMKLAFLQCRHYAELLSELRSSLELLEPDLLPPGLRCARRRTLEQIESTAMRLPR